MIRKLIETAIPLDEINRASAREKSIRHGHPSTLHLWWARRPLATARAVLFASLVDEPADRPDLYPTVEAQDAKRKELFELIGKLVQWENSSDQDILRQAHDEIKRCVGEIPHVLDPFAGGGTIPLEAQRLGLHAHATDLNPVAVLINKAMIELPAHYSNQPPQNPDAHYLLDESKTFTRAQGLAADVEYYGRRLKALATERIGHLYPTVELDDGSHATAIAWIWARTVECDNPACYKIIPLVHSFVLSKKHEDYVRLILEGDRFRFEIARGKDAPKGTITRGGAHCPFCGADVRFEHIRAEGKAGRLGVRLMAIVAEGKKGRIYLAPNDKHVKAADVPRPEDTIDAPLPKKALGFRVQEYGLDNYNQLFTNRQLTALTTFSELISDVRDEIVKDIGDQDYANAIVTYLALLVSKLSDMANSLNRWELNAECPRQLFGRQAIPMAWDFAEANIFSNSSGSFSVLLKNMIRSLCSGLFSFNRKIKGEANQYDALKPFELNDIIISTDPPYYDNVPYAALSDFFYVWLRRSLRKIYPRLFMRMITPKVEELISEPHRHGSNEKARVFFEKNMKLALKNIYEASTTKYPISIYYAYRQDEEKVDAERLSKGWETMLQAIVDVGFIIVGTWPVRTEMMSRMRSHESNALSTSIVIVCRKPPEPKPHCSYNQFLLEFERSLGASLADLQRANLSPVDMAQASIGPGMKLYSRYESIMRGDGRVMDIRSALRLINKGLDDFLNAQDADLDNESKFCIELYKQTGFDPIDFGQGQLLATAKNVAMSRLREMGLVEAERGIVRLMSREELSDDMMRSCKWVTLQRMVHWTMTEGVRECARALLGQEFNSLNDAIKRLAYQLYNLSEQKHWTEEAQGYSYLVEMWELIESILSELRFKKEQAQEQTALQFEE